MQLAVPIGNMKQILWSNWLPDWARWAQKKIHLSGTSNFVIWAIDAMGSTRAAVEMQNEIFQRKRENGWWRVPTWHFNIFSVEHSAFPEKGCLQHKLGFQGADSLLLTTAQTYVSLTNNLAPQNWQSAMYCMVKIFREVAHHWAVEMNGWKMEINLIFRISCSKTLQETRWWHLAHEKSIGKELNWQISFQGCQKCWNTRQRHQPFCAENIHLMSVHFKDNFHRAYIHTEFPYYIKGRFYGEKARDTVGQTTKRSVWTMPSENIFLVTFFHVGIIMRIALLQNVRLSTFLLVNVKRLLHCQFTRQTLSFGKCQYCFI